MDRVAIEKEARRIQTEIWSRRNVRYPLGVPGIPTLFDPRNVADYCGLLYEVRPHVITDNWGGGGAVGVWNRDRMTIVVSSAYSYEVQRYTAGHEIGHYVLHPQVGDRRMHREFSMLGGHAARPIVEQEADYFSACLLMPRGAVTREFDARFGTKHPLVLNEAVAFHLGATNNQLFAEPAGSLLFAQYVARAQSFDRSRFPSLATHFGVSPLAMAIRLTELNLVVAYLH